MPKADSSPEAMVVGLTGGVASGKSTVARAFEDLGAPVLDADQVARDVVAAGTPGFDAVIAAFGQAVVADDGQLDRAALRAQVFSDPQARRALEAIIHPAVRRAMMRWLGQQAGQPYAILMIPLLVESGLNALAQQIVVVDVPEAMQIERLVERDAITTELADSMLAAQATRAQRLTVADHVIDNSGPVERIPPQVSAVHSALCATAAKT